MLFQWKKLSTYRPLIYSDVCGNKTITFVPIVHKTNMYSLEKYLYSIENSISRKQADQDPHCFLYIFFSNFSTKTFVAGTEKEPSR